MGSNTIIVREYLESLKEDTELDYLFPILLNLMGFRIVATAKESKGQSQYGKDIVAIGKDEKGVKKRFYFELKGHTDKDITQSTLLKSDGILESIRESKYTAFNDTSVSGFNSLPIQFVVVHNGVLKSDTRLTFEGIIQKEFPEGNFERWDIYHLTDLFSKYLFGEYLLTDEETIRLFKRTLVLLDAPEYDFSDFHNLISIQTKKTYKVGSRAFKKFFASMNLLSVVIIHYAKENNNLHPAKECVTHLLLKTWEWILSNGLDNKSGVLKEFRKILRIHFELLNDYFRKTNVAVNQFHGLYSEAGQFFETVGYPLRAMEYINYLIYFMHARISYPTFSKTATEAKRTRLLRRQLEYLAEIINKNSATARPLIEYHSIAIMNIVLYILKNEDSFPEGRQILKNYLGNVLNSIIVIKNIRNRFPELYNNIEALTEFCATGKRPHSYQDGSSMMIATIFEILAIIDDKKNYEYYRESFSTLNLQIAFSNLPTENLELLLFEKNLHNEYQVKAGIELPEDFNIFKDQIKEAKKPKRNYKTDQAGFEFLRYLAHIYYKNEYLPDEWRQFYS